jgi:hypothetical protein
MIVGVRVGARKSGFAVGRTVVRRRVWAARPDDDRTGRTMYRA